MRSNGQYCRPGVGGMDVPAGQANPNNKHREKEAVQIRILPFWAPAGTVPRVSPIRCPMALEPKYVQVPWSLFGLRTSFGGTSAAERSELLQPTSSAAAPQPDSRAAGGHRREVLTVPAPSLQQPVAAASFLASTLHAQNLQDLSPGSQLPVAAERIQESLRILQGGLCRLGQADDLGEDNNLNKKG